MSRAMIKFSMHWSVWIQISSSTYLPAFWQVSSNTLSYIRNRRDKGKFTELTTYFSVYFTAWGPSLISLTVRWGVIYPPYTWELRFTVWRWRSEVTIIIVTIDSCDVFTAHFVFVRVVEVIPLWFWFNAIDIVLRVWGTFLKSFFCLALCRHCSLIGWFSDDWILLIRWWGRDLLGAQRVCVFLGFVQLLL